MRAAGSGCGIPRGALQGGEHGRSDLGAELIPEFWQHHVERWWLCVCLLLLRTQKQLGHF